MEILEFECETITPMFLGGADQEKAEFRAPSFKGLLRFWWRAANPKNLNKEALIFGSSAGDNGSRSASFRLQVRGNPKTTRSPFPKQNIQVSSKGKPFPVNILEYLVYGTYAYQRGPGNVFTRDYIPIGTPFTLSLSFPVPIFKDDVLQSLFLLCQFGGLGSRSRNGFGSFDCRPVGGQNLFQAYENRKLLEPSAGLQAYSAFVGGAKLFRTKEVFPTWDQALGKLGKVYRECRGKLENKHTYAKRQYIGAPIVVQKRQESDLDRRAKPYFLKVRKESSSFRGYVLYLPSNYCDGLEKDYQGRSVNHSQKNEKFSKITEEFNGHLATLLQEVTIQ